MRAILIPLVSVVLSLALQATVSASACIDQNQILADDGEKDETEKKDKNPGPGDEEPGCE
jgi:hypothetical protein